MLKLIRTNSDNEDFISLVEKLNAYLKIMDGDEHNFYMQYNKIDGLKNCVVALLNGKTVGCGDFKTFNNDSVEIIKRMFTLQEKRSIGIASSILKELEVWAKELNYKYCVLETGKRQIEAVNFYKKNYYQVIPNFGQYKNIDNSLCFMKELL